MNNHPRNEHHGDEDEIAAYEREIKRRMTEEDYYIPTLECDPSVGYFVDYSLKIIKSNGSIELIEDGR